METANKKIYKPTNDYFFGKIFGDNDSTNILKDFLQAILPDINIHKVELVKQAYIDRIKPKKKFGRMDILATLNNGVKVNIEMQINDLKNTISRSLYYEERLGSTDLNANSDYNNIPRAISIWILDYDLFEDGTYHDISRLRRDFNFKILTDKLEIHYIQLPKFKKECKKISTKLEQWLTFIINDNLEEIERMSNKNIKEAQSKLEYLNGNDEERAIAEYIADAERNEYSALSSAKKEGKNEGIAEGKAKGRIEGIVEGKIQVIKKMLSKNIDIKTISELTEISTQEILNIKDQITNNE